jgi:hypothetical protein
MYVVGYIIAAAVVVCACAILGLRIYRRARGRIDTSKCTSCNCHPTAAKLSVSMETQVKVAKSEQGNDHEDGRDKGETFSSQRGLS